MNALRFLLALALGGAAVVGFRRCRRDEEGLRCAPLRPGRTTCLMEPLMLPLALALGSAILLAGRFHRPALYARLALLFLQIGLYYALLLPALPLLRRVISAGACAALWLVPTVLYCVVWLGDAYARRPLFAVALPLRYARPLAAVWACGAAVLLCGQVASHLRFRRRLLRGAAATEDAALRAMWRGELRRHGVRADIPVLVSADVGTPLTIGCFTSTMRLVLPACGYTGAELGLIFRHELRHIVRCDTRLKFFLGFCAAMCWFNPLGWIARRKAAEDLELSCDEAVLVGESDAVRRLYAALLLRSAGERRGFTTCLSPAAGTLRRRLRCVVSPPRRLPGGFAIGLALCVLCLSFGAAALTDTPTPARTLLPAARAVSAVFVGRWGEGRYVPRAVYGYDGAALADYFAALRVRPVYAGNYEAGETRWIEADCGPADRAAHLTLYDGLLFIRLPGGGETVCLVEDAVDWAYLDALLDFDAPDPDPAPQPPEMTARFFGAAGCPAEPLYADREVLAIAEDGISRPVPAGLAGEGAEPGGIFGFPVSQAALAFTLPSVGGFTVTVAAADGSGAYTVRSAELTDDMLPLAPYAARDAVEGDFRAARGTVYTVRFRFDVGPAAD